MRTVFLVVLIGFQTLSWGDEPRTWKLKSGVAFEAEFSGFAPPNQVVITKSQDRKAYRVSIADLSEADQVFLKPLLVIQQLKARGLIELTSKLIENFPETVNQKQGWMDAKFLEIDSSVIDVYMDSAYKTISLAFEVRDREEKFFRFCYARKENFSKVLLNLKRGDHIRIEGKVASMGTSRHWLVVSAISKLQSTEAVVVPAGAIFNGKVLSVDKGNFTLKLAGEKGANLQVHAMTKITKDGKPATINDLKVGDDVSGEYRTSANGKLELRTLKISLRPPGEAK